MSPIPIIIRLVSASVRIIPATIIVGVLGYLGFEGAKKYFDPKPEKDGWDYDLVAEAKTNKERLEKEKENQPK